MSLQIALDQYAQRKQDVVQFRDDIDNALGEIGQATQETGDESKQRLKEMNVLIDSRTNTLKNENVKEFYDNLLLDDVVDNAEALALIQVQFDWRISAQSDINASVTDVRQLRKDFNLQISALVDQYVENLVKVTKGLRPKAFAKVNRLRTLVASLELVDASKIDFTEDITAEGHPIQEILTLLK
jgi:enamine deaminase RidA (YjgF/YER057c/UK114 family)